MKHLEDCPVEPYIPIYLLVGGCVGLLKVLSMLWMQVRYRTVNDSLDDDDDDDAEHLAAPEHAVAAPDHAVATLVRPEDYNVKAGCDSPDQDWRLYTDE